MLTDSRLSISHSTMENIILLQVKDRCWTEQERAELIENALIQFMSNARKIKPVSTSNFSAALDVDPDSELNGEIESMDTCSSS